MTLFPYEIIAPPVRPGVNPTLFLLIVLPAILTVPFWRVVIPVVFPEIMQFVTMMSDVCAPIPEIELPVITVLKIVPMA